MSWRARLHRPTRAVLASLVAAATLAGSGLVADSALAGGGEGNKPGSGGSGGNAGQFWQYKDDASGSWGPATDYQSVVNAFNAAGVNIVNQGAAYDGPAKIRAALAEAHAECVAGFHRRHPGEGDGDCRVVAVGAVAGNGAGWDYNGSAIVTKQDWIDNWNKYIAPNEYAYAGAAHYHTSDGFTDDPSTSVDQLAMRGLTDSTNIKIVVLDKYQPAPPDYNLSVDTKAGNLSVQSGDTADATDTITLSRDRDVNENVNGTATLHWRGPDGTEKTASKQFTAANNGTVTVSASYKDMDASWEAWPGGRRWWDISIPKQGKMKAAASHLGEQDADESGITTTPPPVKELYNAAGDKVEAPNDQIASGSLGVVFIGTPVLGVSRTPSSGVQVHLNIDGEFLKELGSLLKDIYGIAVGVIDKRKSKHVPKHKRGH